MTPEERWTKIENALQYASELNARAAERLDKHDERLAQHESTVEKQNAGIRDLIVVSRTFLESQKQASAQIQELRQAQHATGEKLNTLIDTVDRFLKGLRGPNGSGP